MRAVRHDDRAGRSSPGRPIVRRGARGAAASGGAPGRRRGRRRRRRRPPRLHVHDVGGPAVRRIAPGPRGATSTRSARTSRTPGSWTPRPSVEDGSSSRPAEVALAEAGDLLIPIQEGAIDRSHVVADLGELVRGSAVRRSPRRRDAVQGRRDGLRGPRGRQGRRRRARVSAVEAARRLHLHPDQARRVGTSSFVTRGRRHVGANNQGGDGEVGVCHVCGKTFASQELLSLHLLEEHADEGLAEALERRCLVTQVEPRRRRRSLVRALRPQRTTGRRPPCICRPPDASR